MGQIFLKNPPQDCRSVIHATKYKKRYGNNEKVLRIFSNKLDSFPIHVFCAAYKWMLSSLLSDLILQAQPFHTHSNTYVGIQRSGGALLDG